MIRFFLFILLLAVTAVGSFLLWQLPGGVTFDLFGRHGELNLFFAIVAIVVLGALVALIVSLAIGAIRLPGKFGKSRRAAKVKKANMALTDGLLAAEAGDVGLQIGSLKRQQRLQKMIG